MPMLIPLMYFVTKGVQAFLKREKKLQKYEKLFCILVCVAASGGMAFTWARIIYPMYCRTTTDCGKRNRERAVKRLEKFQC